MAIWYLRVTFIISFSFFACAKKGMGEGGRGREKRGMGIIIK